MELIAEDGSATSSFSTHIDPDAALCATSYAYDPECGEKGKGKRKSGRFTFCIYFELDASVGQILKR